MRVAGERVEMLATFAGSIALLILGLGPSSPPFHPAHQLTCPSPSTRNSWKLRSGALRQSHLVIVAPSLAYRTHRNPSDAAISPLAGNKAKIRKGIDPGGVERRPWTGRGAARFTQASLTRCKLDRPGSW